MSGHHPSLQADVELIGPGEARAWLQDAAANRNVSLRQVDRHAEDMLAGRWMTNGQPIIFNAEGKLIDGRHRLSAVILANVAVAMLVVRGVAQEAFATMDSGRARTLADVLSIQGHKHNNVLAASARVVWNYCAGVSLRYQPPRAMLVQLVANHLRFEQAVTQVASRSHKTSLIPVTQTAAVMALANESLRWNGEVGRTLHGRRDGVRGGGALLDRVRPRGEAGQHLSAGDGEQRHGDDRGIRRAAVVRRARYSRRPRGGVRAAEGDAGRARGRGGPQRISPSTGLSTERLGGESGTKELW
jgi:hypothetical protein